LRLLLLFLLLNVTSFAQTKDSLSNVDTVRHHSPRKAALFSAIVPGMGQIYNHSAMPKGKKKAFWKVPLIYAGLGTTGYLLYVNQKKATEYKTEYNTRIAGNIGDPDLLIYNNDAILSLFYTHQSRRDLFILGTVAIYGFQVVDALIEAHFVEFDISKDLSLKITPAYVANAYAGVRLNLKIK
jgi:hypothetical protein